MTATRADGSPRVRPKRLPTWALKQAMAVTGIVFVAFVFIHMIGNLKVYGGPESLDGYATWLRQVGYPLIPHHGVLWALRIVLLISVIVHVVAAVILAARGRRARGQHRRRRLQGFTANAARTMLPGGVLILIFIVLHVLDLTIGAGVAPSTYQPPSDDGTVHAYANLVASFSRLPMALLYSLTMVVIAVHIVHGWRTIMQDVGLTGRRTRAVWTGLGALLALGILIGNALIPLFVQIQVIT